MKLLLFVSTIAVLGHTAFAQTLPDCTVFASHPHFIAYPNSCTQYWVCQTAVSTPFLDTCPSGEHFHENEQICIDENLSDCEITTDPTDPTDPTPAPTDLPSDSTDDEDEPETTTNPPGPTPDPPSPPVNVCLEQPDGRFINDPTLCRSYFICINETPFQGQCDMGYNFNEERQMCDFPSSTPCTNENFECPFWGISRWEVPGTCNQYNFCFGGAHIVRTCADGLLFDSDRQICVLSEETTCTRDECPVVDDIYNLVTRPSLVDCEQYYMCFNGQFVLFFCAPGTHWNNDRQQCETPADANCQLPEEPTTTTTEPPAFEIECPIGDDELHHFPHPYDCSAYFICISGRSHLQFCADGLKFDASISRCNLPDLVTCPEDTRAKNNFMGRFARFFKLN